MVDTETSVNSPVCFPGRLQRKHDACQREGGEIQNGKRSSLLTGLREGLTNNAEPKSIF